MARKHRPVGAEMSALEPRVVERMVEAFDADPALGSGTGAGTGADIGTGAGRSRTDHPEAMVSNRFGSALMAALESREISQTMLATELDTSRAYVSAVIRGVKPVSPERIEQISSRIGLTDVERTRLHRGAAADRGFRLDLPDDF